jgi:hypothetical protein
MKEARVHLLVEVALDAIPGTFDNANDFVRLIKRAVPPWYLRDVQITAEFDADRPREAEKTPLRG